MLPLAQLADIFDFELIGRIGLSSPIVGHIVGWALVGIPAKRTHWRLCLWYYLVAAILWGMGVGAMAVAGASQILAIIGCPMLLVILGGPIVGIIATSPRQLRSKYPPDHCQTCGYNLTGNTTGRCPECRIAVTDRPHKPEMRSPSAIFWSSCGLLVVLLVLASPVFRQDSLIIDAIWSALIFACGLRAFLLLKYLTGARNAN